MRCQRNLILFQCLCLSVQGPKQHIKRSIADLLRTREDLLASVCAIVVLYLSRRRTTTMRESRRKARTQEHTQNVGNAAWVNETSLRTVLALLSLFMQINVFQQSSCQMLSNSNTSLSGQGLDAANEGFVVKASSFASTLRIRLGDPCEKAV